MREHAILPQTAQLYLEGSSGRGILRSTGSTHRSQQSLQDSVSLPFTLSSNQLARLPQAWAEGQQCLSSHLTPRTPPGLGPGGLLLLTPDHPASLVSRCHLSALVCVSAPGTQDVSSAQG